MIRVLQHFTSVISCTLFMGKYKNHVTTQIEDCGHIKVRVCSSLFSLHSHIIWVSERTFSKLVLLEPMNQLLLGTALKWL